MFIFFLTSSSQTDTQGQIGSSYEYRLRADLSRRYDDIRRQMVPGQDQGLSPLRLSFEMMAIKIMEFDEDKDIITLYGWNRMVSQKGQLA